MRGTRSPAPAPLDWLDDIGGVLFDLDGTLHDDPRSTEQYATAVEVALGPGGQGLQQEVAAVVAGRHPALHPGRFVEPQRGLVLRAPDWVVDAATDWTGQPVAVPEELRGPVRHDGALRYLGDRWQIVAAVAERRGADSSVLREAFTLARGYVNDPANELSRFACLDGLLDRLAARRRLLLATNTSEPLGRPLVERLGMRHAFALVHYDARKPSGWRELLATASSSWGVPVSQLMVVGDNLWNDLVVPAAHGCRTVHIDPLAIDPAGRNSTVRYPDLSSFAAELENAAYA